MSVIHLILVIAVNLLEVRTFQEKILETTRTELREYGPGDTAREPSISHTLAPKDSEKDITPDVNYNGSEPNFDCPQCGWQKPWYTTSLLVIGCCLAALIFCLAFLLAAHYTVKTGNHRNFSLRRISTSFRRWSRRRQPHNSLPTLYDVTTIESVNSLSSTTLPTRVTTPNVTSSRLDRFVGLDTRVPPLCHTQRSLPPRYEDGPPRYEDGPPVYSNTADFIDLEKRNNDTGHYLNMSARIS